MPLPLVLFIGFALMSALGWVHYLDDSYSADKRKSSQAFFERVFLICAIGTIITVALLVAGVR